MSYQALYRQWRPLNFSDVVGQKHITQTLQNAVKNNHIAHAYLFSGPRGVGKTSTARILAKAVNCKSVKNGNPCNECDVCVGINQGRSLDIIEIDAASNNGVDEIRDLREKVKYAPMECDYKVYIIDEVHMLSPAAFNALLKTLEEPPEHVIFILATTEAHKIPATIKSRCQRFDFHRIKTSDITNHLEYIANSLDVEFEAEALALIARAADGALRDAISIFDQCLSFDNDKISLGNVMDLLGAVDDSIFYDLTEMLESGEITNALDVIGQQYYEGRSLEQLLIDYSHYLRNLLLIKNSADREIVSFNIDKMTSQANRMMQEHLYQLIHNVVEAINEVKYAHNQRLVVELALIEYKNIIENDYKSLIARVKTIEKQLEKREEKTSEVSEKILATKDLLKDRIKPKAPKVDKERKNSRANIEKYTKNIASNSKDVEIKREEKPVEKPADKFADELKEKQEKIKANIDTEQQSKKSLKPAEVNTTIIARNWDEILVNVKSRDVITQALLSNASPGEYKDGNLNLIFSNDFHFDQIIKSPKKKIVEETLSEMYDSKITISGLIENGKEEENVSNSDEDEDVIQKALEIFNGQVIKE